MLAHVPVELHCLKPRHLGKRLHATETTSASVVFQGGRQTDEFGAKCRDQLQRHDVDHSLDLEELATNLTKLGYERVSTIDQEGTWSRRGDIVDVFPVSSELPVRLEFFGDELDKLREFDPASQRSLDPIESLRLTPTGFSPLIAQQLRDAMPDGLEQLLSEESLSELLEGGTPEGMRRLLGLAWAEPASLLDYLPADSCVAIDERRHGRSHGDQWLDHAREHFEELALPLPILHREIEAAMGLAEAFPGFDLAELHERDDHPNAFDLNSRPVPAYPNQFGKLGELIKGYSKEKQAVWLLSAQPSRAVAPCADGGAPGGSPGFPTLPKSWAPMPGPPFGVCLREI